VASLRSNWPMHEAVLLQVGMEAAVAQTHARELGGSPRHHGPAMSSRDRDLLAGFARRLIQAREAAGYATQTALAEAIGLSGHHNVHRWEKGHHFPRVPELYRLARLLGVTIDWLVAGDPAGLSAETSSRLR
jgi:ribosome-binding protein aMBF1 (putative translation factor)